MPRSGTRVPPCPHAHHACFYVFTFSLVPEDRAWCPRQCTASPALLHAVVRGAVYRTHVKTPPPTAPSPPCQRRHPGPASAWQWWHLRLGPGVGPTPPRGRVACPQRGHPGAQGGGWPRWVKGVLVWVRVYGCGCGYVRMRVCVRVRACLRTCVCTCACLLAVVCRGCAVVVACDVMDGH